MSLILNTRVSFTQYVLQIWKANLYLSLGRGNEFDCYTYCNVSNTGKKITADRGS